MTDRAAIILSMYRDPEERCLTPQICSKSRDMTRRPRLLQAAGLFQLLSSWCCGCDCAWLADNERANFAADCGITEASLSNSMCPLHSSYCRDRFYQNI